MSNLAEALRSETRVAQDFARQRDELRETLGRFIPIVAAEIARHDRYRVKNMGRNAKPCGCPFCKELRPVIEAKL
jgi:hypothetical protein